jgi:hypothetical protein
MALTLLIQFVFRLSFGLALAMAVTPSRLVTSGFYRVHLWVLLGLATLAGLAAFIQRDPLQPAGPWGWVLLVAIAAAAVSYVGAILWLYERARAGKLAIALVAITSLAGALLATPWEDYPSATAVVLALADVASGGLVLGVTMAAMLLGHWYLNTPTMQLVPLKRLVLLMGLAVIVRGVLAALGLSLEMSQHALGTTTLWFIALRWLSGLIGLLVLAIMAWQTLKVPNTQSATGILYVGVICSFLGELCSQLLSVETLYPV